MASYDYGKDEIARLVRQWFPRGAKVLDVGACDGKWRLLLAEYDNMEAVEIWPPKQAKLEKLYKRVYITDIADFKYDHYDLIIFGDVIEHMDVETAQAVLEYAVDHCDDMIVAVPWQYKQGALGGNPYEEHKQDDLTPEIFAERYPMLELIRDTGYGYAYYHKGPAKPKKEEKKPAKPKAPRRTRAKK